MQEFNLIKEYCDKVCEQIRWKKARPTITKEMENHLYDQSDAYRESLKTPTKTSKNEV